MPKKEKKYRNLTKAETIAKTPIEEIAKLKGESGRQQLIKDIKSLRMGYNRRVQSFRRRGVFSYAQYAFESSAPEFQRDLDKMTRNQLIGEFARYQSFFESQTSNIKGIKAINLAQDLRIFGEDKKGKPLGTMTEDQRKMYWSLYDEYKNQYKTGIFRYSSESVQQFLASVVFDDGSRSSHIQDILNETESRLATNKLEEDLGSVPNVYSGKGPYRSR